MNTKIQAILFLFFFALAPIYSQKDYRNGFIITLEKDTIKGQVDYRSNTKNYASCLFKTDNQETTYFPDQILGFGYEQDKFFSAQIVEGTFVEVLVTGALSLYKSNSKYHLKKGDDFFDLVSSRTKVEENGVIGYKIDKRWRRIISRQIEDCLEEHNTLVSKNRLKFQERSITKLVIQYNKCKNAPFTEYKASKPWTKFEVGLAIGFINSSVHTTKNAFDMFSHLEDTYHSNDPSVGLALGLYSPRMSDRIAFQIETHFIKANYASLVILDRGAATEYHDTYIAINAISIPLSFKYIFPGKRLHLFLQGGTNFDVHLNSYTQLLSESISRNVVNSSPKKDAFVIDNNQFGYWCGVGIAKKLKGLEANLTARFFHMHSFDNTSAFTAKNNRFSLNLILFKK